jgi:predicted nucleic acid-binding protein
MIDPFVDTDVIIRLLTNDDPTKQAEALHLFEAVEFGHLSLVAPDTVIADAVYVLSSPRLYHLERSEVHALLSPLMRLSGFRVENKRALTIALEVYASSNLDFGDALIVASMQQRGTHGLYSYDAHFDHIPGLKRLEPKEVASSVGQDI